MDQTEFAVEEIVIEHALRAVGKSQTGPSLTVHQLDRAAGFHHAQHGNQALAETALADDVLNEFFFVVDAGETFVGSVAALGHGFGVIDQSLRLLLDKRQKIFAAHFEAIIDKAIELSVASERKIALENDS